jgi:FG-GAP-like repeat
VGCRRSRILVGLAWGVLSLVAGWAPTASAFVWKPGPGATSFWGHPESVAVGDFNGDGLPDLAVGRDAFSPSNTVGSSNVSVIVADGTGGFRPNNDQPIPLGVGRVQVAAADFNGDGKLDLVAAYDDANPPYRSELALLLGHGDGTFSAAPGSPIALSAGPVWLVVGDFNGDGKPDMVTLNNDNSVSVLLGSGDGTFRPVAGPPLSLGAGRPGSLAVGDFNRDGKLDLAATDVTAGTLSVLLGNGDGMFSMASGSSMAIGDASYPMAVGDFNGDGKLDLALGDSRAGGVLVLLGRGDGTLRPGSLTTIGPGWTMGSLIVGDFDSDGNRDLVLSAYSSTGSAFYLLLGDGSGGFRLARGSPFTVPGTPSFDVHAAGTFDGRPGLVVDQGCCGPYSDALELLLAPLPSDPPTSALTVTPNRALAGSRVKLDASGSSDPLDRAIVDYRWDLGSGRFTYDSGTDPEITRTFSGHGPVHARVQVINSAGETAVAGSQFVIYPRSRAAVVAGSVRECAGPRLRRCSIRLGHVCRPRVGCMTPDRVAAIDALGEEVADQKLKHARFDLRLVPGHYTIELLGDGKRVHRHVLRRRTIILRVRQTATVRFLLRRS